MSVFLSPKSHRQATGDPTVASVKTTVRGAVPDLGEPSNAARRLEAEVDVVGVAVVVAVVVVVEVVVAVVVTAESTIM